MYLSQLDTTDVLYLLGGAWAVSYTVSRLLRRGTSATTPLLGPPSQSWLVGNRALAGVDNEVPIYEKWANEYGRVFQIGGPLGSNRIVLCDPKAIAHFYSKETFTYVQTAFARIFIGTFVGPVALC